MSNSNPQVTVIGAGVIGLACAWSIAKRGASVTVIDAGTPRYGTSNANAGWVSPSHIIPFAAPGMVQMGIKSLLKRDGAFGMTPLAGPLLAQWTAKFAASCTDAHVDYGSPALVELLTNSDSLLRDFIANNGLQKTERDLWYIYSGDNHEADARHEKELMDRFNIPVHYVDRDEALAEEPMLKQSVKSVLSFEGDYGVDPRALVELLIEECTKLGVTFRDGETVTGLVNTASGATISTATDTWTSDYAVLAAGAWSRELAKLVGENLQVMPAKGYSVTIPDVDNMPKRTLMLSEQRIATNPLDWGLRMSTGYILTGNTDREVKMSAVNKMLKRASDVLHLPEAPRELNPWTGLRPSSPDGMPYIGPLPKAPSVIVATGHGMLGNMMAMGTGTLVADQVFGTPTSLESLKFSPARP